MFLEAYGGYVLQHAIDLHNLMLSCMDGQILVNYRLLAVET